MFNKLVGQFTLKRDTGFAVGLDIGSQYIKVVQLNTAGKALSLYDVCVHRRPLETAGQPQPQSLGATLKNVWDQEKIRPRTVRLTISDPSIFIRQISIPAVAEEELAKAVKWQAEKYIPFPIEEAVVDYQPLLLNSQIKELMNIVVVAVKKDIIYQYLEALSEAGLSTTVVDVACFSDMKVLTHLFQDGNSQQQVMLDIGAKTSNIMLVQKNELSFIRNIDCAGEHFTKAVAEGLGIDATEADKKKIELSLPARDEDKDTMRSISGYLEPVMAELTDQTARSLAYCEKEGILKDMKKLSLCGGGAALKGLDAYLAKELNMPVELLNPFENTVIQTKGVDTSELSALSAKTVSALGAALTL